MPELLAVLTDLEPLDADDGDAPPRLPALERLLARGVRLPAPSDWRRFVLDRLGSAVPDAELPVGATIAASAGLAADRGTWLLATPVRLRATLTDLRLDAAAPTPLDAAGTAALAARLTAACGDPGFVLHAVDDVLLAHFAEPLAVRTTDPAPLAGRRLDADLPAGPDGGRVRRRMTELQMLLHDAPAGGANALWLWGGGSAVPAGRRRWPAVATDDPFLRALHRLDGGRVDDFDARLVTWRLATLGAPFADADRAWFAPLADELARGRVARATVHFAGRAFVLTPAQRWRVWVRPRPWWELAA